jgi:hypothetical protein
MKREPEVAPRVTRLTSTKTAALCSTTKAAALCGTTLAQPWEPSVHSVLAALFAPAVPPLGCFVLQASLPMAGVGGGVGWRLF